MEILIDGKWKKPGYTISRVYVNGEYQGYNALEDPDRGLDSKMPLSEISKVKIKGNTRIPHGRYRVIFTYSPKFNKDMPLLVGVPGYEGVRIHPGNSNKDTEGCILIGRNDKVGWISESKKYTGILIDKIKAAINKGEIVYITIQ